MSKTTTTAPAVYNARTLEGLPERPSGRRSQFGVGARSAGSRGDPTPNRRRTGVTLVGGQAIQLWSGVFSCGSGGRFADHRQGRSSPGSSRVPRSASPSGPCLCPRASLPMCEVSRPRWRWSSLQVPNLHGRWLPLLRPTKRQRVPGGCSSRFVVEVDVHPHPAPEPVLSPADPTECPVQRPAGTDDHSRRETGPCCTSPDSSIRRSPDSSPFVGT